MDDHQAARLLDVAVTQAPRWDPWLPRPRRYACTGEPRLNRLIGRCERGVDYLPPATAGLVLVFGLPGPVVAAMVVAVPIHLGYLVACRAIVRAATRRYAPCIEHTRDVHDTRPLRARTYVVCHPPWSPKKWFGARPVRT